MYFRHPIPKTYSTMEDEKEVKGVGEPQQSIISKDPTRHYQLESTARVVSRELKHTSAALGESGLPEWLLMIGASIEAPTSPDLTAPRNCIDRELLLRKKYACGY